MLGGDIPPTHLLNTADDPRLQYIDIDRVHREIYSGALSRIIMVENWLTRVPV